MEQQMSARSAGRAPGPAQVERRATEGPRVPNHALVVGRADDRSERDADAVAERVLGLLGEPRSSGRAASAGPDPLGGRVVPQDVQRRIDASTGASIEPARRTRMEGAFGTDLSHVRIHRGAEADDLSRSLQAKAFTRGDDIFLGRAADRDDVLAHELAHANQGDDAAVRRFPATVFQSPLEDWPRQTGGVVRPGEGRMGGVYILSARDQDDLVDKVVAKPMFANGRIESGEQTVLANTLLRRLFGVSAPESRMVKPGSAEFGELVDLCEPEQPRPENEDGDNEGWHPMSSASSFVVMGAVPEGVSLYSLTKQAGAGDATALEVLCRHIFDDGFLAQLGRLAVGDLFLGNEDRMVARAMNLGNVMVSKGKGPPTAWAIDSNAVFDTFDPNELIGMARTSTQMGTARNPKLAFNDRQDGVQIVDDFFQQVAASVARAGTDDGPLPENVQGPQDIITLMFEAERQRWADAFEQGWAAGIAAIREAIESKEGRHRLQETLDEHRGEDPKVGERMDYQALKTAALYLTTRNEGKTHEETKPTVIARAAAKTLARIQPDDYRVPEDDFAASNRRPMPAKFADADLRRLESAPRVGAINQTVNISGDRSRTIPAKVEELRGAVAAMRDEVSGLRKKGLSKVFSRSATRHRAGAGDAVADAYLAGAGTARATTMAMRLRGLARTVELAVEGDLTRGQAGEAIPAAAFLTTAIEPVRAELVAQVETTRQASADVSSITAYENGRTLADALDGRSEQADQLGQGALATVDQMDPEAMVAALRAKAT